MTDQEIETTIKNILAEDFEVDVATLTPETNLFTELDLDSMPSTSSSVFSRRPARRSIPLTSRKSARSAMSPRPSRSL